MTKMTMFGILFFFLIATVQLRAQDQKDQREQDGKFDINAAIENVVKNNDGKFDQECVKALMSEAGKHGAEAEVAMVQNLMRKYPGQLSLIRLVALKCCSDAASENCRKAVIAFLAEKKKSVENASKSGLEEKKSATEKEERLKSTAGKSARGQFSSSSENKKHNAANTGDTDAGDSLSYTPRTAKNLNAVLSQGETKMIEEQRASP